MSLWDLVEQVAVADCLHLQGLFLFFSFCLLLFPVHGLCSF